MNVFVHNRQRRVPIDLPAVAALARQAEAECAKEKSLVSLAPEDLEEVQITLVSDRRIAGLHRRFLHARGATDVITFDHGEIVISAAAAARGARDHGEPFERELGRYIVHGMLHLRGYEDGTPADRAAMWCVQERVLDRLSFGWPERRIKSGKRVPRR
jgi:probable rRNA maturation factor